jgi:DUF4097 and DUF4098 domain-containing protein YvlB
MIALSVRKGEPADDHARYFGDSKNFDRTFQVKPGDKLILDASEGDISITGNDSEELVVHIVIRGSESFLKKYEVNMEQNGNVVSIRSRHERGFFQWFNDGSIEARYEVQLPRKFNMKVGTSGGNIDLTGVDGELRGETSGGDLRIDDAHGTVDLSTSGGNVKVRNLSGAITLGTSGGDIYGDELEGKTQVETSGGNISIQGAQGSMRASTSGGDIKVEMKDHNGIDLSTSGGSVSLTLPKNAAGEISAETSGGEVSCDFPINGRLREGSLHAKINGGGERIHLESSGGDIIIHGVE